MKKLLFLPLLLMFLGLRAQNYSISSLYSEASYYINLIENKYKSQLIRVEFDITTGMSYTYRYLAKGNVYSLMVIADTSKIQNVDIKVYQNDNNQWKEVASDTKTKQMALLNFEPTKSDIYKFEIIANFKQGQNYGYYCLLIFR